MTDRIVDAHIELRDSYPLGWLVRYMNTDSGPELSLMRTEVANPEHGKAEVAPDSATGLQLFDRASNARLAFLTTAQLKRDVDQRRPVLLLQATGISAFPQPDWPFVFASLAADDPNLGMFCAINTPDTVGAAWLEGTLLDDGDLTVDDLLGGAR